MLYRNDLLGLISGQSYAATVSVSRQSGNPAIDATTSSFAVDLTRPVINDVEVYWGSILNNAEISSGGNITITTASAQDGEVFTLKLMKGNNQIGSDFSGTISANTATISIVCGSGAI